MNHSISTMLDFCPGSLEWSCIIENNYICKPIWWSSSAPWQKWSSWFPMRRNRKGWDSSQLKFSRILLQKYAKMRFTTIYFWWFWSCNQRGQPSNKRRKSSCRRWPILAIQAKPLLTCFTTVLVQLFDQHPKLQIHTHPGQFQDFSTMSSVQYISILHLLHRIKQQKHLARKTLPTQKCEKRKQFQDSKNDYLTTNIHKSSLVLSTYLARRGTMTPTTTVPLRTSLLKLAQTGWKTHPQMEDWMNMQSKGARTPKIDNL